MNNTETERDRLRRVVNEVLNPGTTDGAPTTNWYEILATTRDDIIKLRTHSRSYTRNMPTDEQGLQMANAVVESMQQYFDSVKALFTYAFEQTGDVPGRQQFEKYLDYEFNQM